MRYFLEIKVSQMGKVFALLAFLACIKAWGACNFIKNVEISGCSIDQLNCVQNIGCGATQKVKGSFSQSLSSRIGQFDYTATMNYNCNDEGALYYLCNRECSIQTTNYGTTYYMRCAIYGDTNPPSSSSQAQSSSSQAQSSSSTDNPPRCTYCEDYVDYDEFPPIAKSKNYVCLQCSTDPITGATVATGCDLERDSEGSCEDNNDCPSETICNAENPNVDCYATVGATVYLRDRKSGHIWGCDADGNCQMALNKYASGQCQDPNPPPNSSNSVDNSSSSGGANSSSSEGGSSGSQGPWGLEKTLKENTAYAQKTAENTGDIANYTVTIMGKTSDIYNELIEYGITLNNIKDNTDDIKGNTGATATNTGNINEKLTTTNSLLTDIKNKNWQPHIDVQPPEVTVNVQGDTNSVTVNVDTSHAPSEILGFLRGLFGGDTTGWNGDTTGWNGITDSAQKSFDSAIVKSDLLQSLNCDTTGGRKCDDKILGAHALDSATARLKSAYKGIVDTLKNGAFGDSLNNWGSKFTGNNVIAGSGSNSCPSVLTRSYHVQIIQGAGFDMTLGTYLCNPIFGNVTAWTLCRLLLRATVALACMWFLFKCATGFRGQGGDDD